MNQETTPKVTLFSTSTCPWCIHAKSFLKKNQIEFEEVNVGVDQAKAIAMVQISGQMGVPQFWIEDEVVVGFDQRRLLNVINKNNINAKISKYLKPGIKPLQDVDKYYQENKSR